MAILLVELTDRRSPLLRPRRRIPLPSRGRVGGGGEGGERGGPFDEREGRRERMLVDQWWSKFIVESGKVGGPVGEKEKKEKQVVGGNWAVAMVTRVLILLRILSGER